jgi:hypothetical protein
MELSAEERDQLQRLEEDLWREETRFDGVYMERLIDGVVEKARRSSPLS